MCGVIGYIGKGATPEFFFNGLKRLEYRGYDSAGIAMLTHEGIFIERAEGKLLNLQSKLKNLPPKAVAGIGHTRWATHGKPTENNAHPHRSSNIVLLHNGIIENHTSLKKMLREKGYEFKSETDTEVAAHLLHFEFSKQDKSIKPEERMKTAIHKMVEQLKGAYAFGILCQEIPNTLYAVKLGSPLVIGIGEGENYIASGITALVEHTQKTIVLEDREIAYLTPNGVEITTFDAAPVHRQPSKVEWSVAMMEKGGYRHFMLKEIHEQPQALAQTLSGRINRDSGRINLEDYGVAKIDLAQINRLQLIACGTSHYASLLGKYFIESVARIPVEIDLASEYRYRPCTADNQTLAVAISQSGETADTLQAIKYARESGARTLAIVNVPGSTIAHNCECESLIHAGPEIGVASTKVFSSQVMSLFLLGLAIAQERKSLSAARQKEIAEDLVKAPSLVESCLELSKHIEGLANTYHKYSSILYIGRGSQWGIALEGALKLKELSYIHAEAYAGGELKHGPIALIDENMPVVCLAPQDAYYEKMVSNIEEVRARGARTLTIGFADDEELKHISNDFIPVPRAPELLLPFLTTIPMHLLGYWIAVRKGTDVDQPRNLAKSVTVE
jgi:glucosamine--fructose-6-phosphate aminotransferase (isomerizing)